MKTFGYLSCNFYRNMNINKIHRKHIDRFYNLSVIAKLASADGKINTNVRTGPKWHPLIFFSELKDNATGEIYTSINSILRGLVSRMSKYVIKEGNVQKTKRLQKGC